MTVSNVLARSQQIQTQLQNQGLTNQQKYALVEEYAVLNPNDTQAQDVYHAWRSSMGVTSPAPSADSYTDQGTPQAPVAADHPSTGGGLPPAGSNGPTPNYGSNYGPPTPVGSEATGATEQSPLTPYINTTGNQQTTVGGGMDVANSFNPTHNTPTTPTTPNTPNTPTTPNALNAQNVSAYVGQQVNNPTLPPGTAATYTPIQANDNEFLNYNPLDPNATKAGPAPQAGTSNVEANYNISAPTVTAPTTQAATAGTSAPVQTPTNPGASTYNAQTIGNAPQAGVVQGQVNQNNLVQAAQGTYSQETMDALNNAAQGTVDPNSLVKNQYAELLDFGPDEIPAWAKGAVLAANEAMNARGISNSTMAGTAISSAIFQAALPIAVQDAKVFENMTLQNLSNRQQMTIAKATALAQMDITNLNNRQQAAIENAKAFLSIDLANLNNAQQTSIVNAQLRAQTLMSDQSAINAAKQFNATSQNQVNQFFASLAAQIQMDNARRADTMSQFNAGEINKVNLQNTQNQLQASMASAQLSVQAQTATAQINSQIAMQNQKVQAEISIQNAQLQSITDRFNAQLKDAREQFNIENSLVVDQANVAWNRAINTANTAGINAANNANAANRFNMSQQALAYVWQEWRDNANWAYTSGERQQDRDFSLALAAFNRDSFNDALSQQEQTELMQAIGRFGADFLKGLLG